MKVGEKSKSIPRLNRIRCLVRGIIVDIENNRFNGIVISIKLDDGRIFFGQERFSNL